MFNKKKLLYIFVFILAVCLTVGLFWLNKHRPFRALNHNPTMLMVFNGKHDAEAENALASIKKNVPELISNLTICISDESSRNFAKKHNLQSFEFSTISETGTYLSIAMNIMTHRKLECILHLLESKQNVLYFDTDVVFLDNPIKELNDNYDLNIQSDECLRPYAHSDLCTGFMYIKSNHKTIKFFKQDIQEIVKSGYKISCQKALVYLVKQQGLLKMRNLFGMSIKVLDVCKFPNGCRYFHRSDKLCKSADALIVHNNHMVGIENKLSRFSKYGLIFSSTTGHVASAHVIQPDSMSADGMSLNENN